MGLYRVAAECVVGDLHYPHPAAEPITADDDQAAPLVERGCLVRVDEPQRPRRRHSGD